MIIEFVNKNGYTITVSCNSSNVPDERAGESLLEMLAKIPDAEFIMRPVIKRR